MSKKTPTMEWEGGEDLATLRIAVTTMGDLLLTAADRDPNKTALVVPEKSYTYAELAARAIRRARSLQALGVSGMPPGFHGRSMGAAAVCALA